MKHLLVIFVFALGFSAAFAQQEEYGKKTYVSSENETLRYRELAPEKLILNQRYPLAIFLHGAGERGDDNETQLSRLPIPVRHIRFSDRTKLTLNTLNIRV